MWVLGPGGWIMPALRPVDKIPAGDHRTLQLRARKREHLSRWRRDYQPSLGATVQLPGTDYEFRAYCTKEEYALALVAAVMDIDYKKFKPETVNRYDDHDLHMLYNRLWGVFIGEMGDDAHQRYVRQSKGISLAKGGGLYRDVHELPAGATGWASYSSASGHWYDASAGRDAVEPEVWDLEGESGWGDEVKTGTEYVDPVDAAFEEIESLLYQAENLGPIDHSNCAHSPTDTARKRCRRREQRSLRMRAEALRTRARQTLTLVSK